MTKPNIPLSIPFLQGNEWQYIKECLDSGWVSSSGEMVNRFEQQIAEYTGSKYAVATINGTTALQIALQLVDVMPGDEVIIPTLTFIAPVNAIHYNNATPVFMDSDDYFVVDIEKTIAFIEKETVFKNGKTFNIKTKRRITAIIPVHVFGNAANLNELYEICINRNIAIVEDACESLGTVFKNGYFSGKHTGVIGDVGCLSFNGNKIITAGGGGMLLVNEEKHAQRAKYLTTQSKDDSNLFIHNEIGYNYRLSSLQAALGIAQFEQLQYFINRKREIYQIYSDKLSSVSGLDIARVPDYALNNHWLNLIVLDWNILGIDRDSVQNALYEAGIDSRPVWKANHTQKMFADCQTYKIEIAPILIANSLCLPSSVGLSDDNVNYIVNELINLL